MYYRHRNLDIALAAVIAILGGLAAAKHLPGQIRIPLGVCLFFAPGYLWSEAILSQRLSGIERVLTTLGLALILPILGGFMFYGLRIPLFESDWIGLLVVLTLLGVVAVAIVRLREPANQWRERKRSQPPRDNGSLVLHSFIFGLAALIGLGSVAYSVKSAEDQKFPGYSAISMDPVVPGAGSFVGTSASGPANPAANTSTATKAHLQVQNHQGLAEQYKVTLVEPVNKKIYDAPVNPAKTKSEIVKTWTITLSSGQSWQTTIAYTQQYSMIAYLYLLPNAKTMLHCSDNGVAPLCTSSS
jgi:hypothetical protein